MTLPFVKMHAHGDDFIIIDRRVSVSISWR